MPRRIEFEVLVEIPHSRSFKVFADMVAAGWGGLREEPVAPLEGVGIGFRWLSRAREGSDASTLPRPWAAVRNALVARKAISPKAHIYALRSEVVHINEDERPRLLVVLERR
jgi:hypothetical protein